MPPKRRQPTRVTRSGKAGTSTSLKVRRKCQHIRSTIQPAGAGSTVPEGNTRPADRDRTNGTASVSNYTPVAKYTAQNTVTKTPAQPSATKIPAQPQSLQLISKYDTDHNCWSVHHHSVTGDILLGCYEGVKIISRQSGEITHLADYPDAVIREHKGEVFISSMNERTVNIYRFDMMSNKTDELLFFVSPAYFRDMSVSDHHIVCKGDGNNIKLYNRVSGTVSTLQLPRLSGGVISLQFLPDETLLVTGFRGSNKFRLNKYRLSDEGEPTLIWSCDDVKGADGVSVADNGLIFVLRVNNKTVYIVSSEGKKIRDIKCDELPYSCYDISIRDDELLVAAIGPIDGVLVYKII